MLALPLWHVLFSTECIHLARLSQNIAAVINHNSWDTWLNNLLSFIPKTLCGMVVYFCGGDNLWAFVQGRLIFSLSVFEEKNDSIYVITVGIIVCMHKTIIGAQLVEFSN